MRTAPLDVGPATVSGAIEAAKARVIWRDGVLAVFTDSDSVLAQVASARPTPNRGVYTAATDDGEVTFTKAGCGCGNSFPLRRVQQSKLLALL